MNEAFPGSWAMLVRNGPFPLIASILSNFNFSFLVSGPHLEVLSLQGLFLVARVGN